MKECAIAFLICFMSGRKTKYTPEIVEKILGVIRETGGDKEGYTSAGIHSATFYKWINEKPEFKEAIALAKLEYRESCPPVLIRQAKKAFADYLFNRVEETWTSFERGVDETGKSWSKETTKRVKRGVPQWCIERVLGKPIDLLEAVKVLVDANILPRWLVQVVTDEVSEARRGVTEAFTGILPDNDQRLAKPGLSEETAAAIRSHILGIENYREGTVELTENSQKLDSERVLP